MDQLSFEDRQENGVTIIVLRGSLDALNAPRLKASTEALGKSTKVVVDLDALALIDSSGVGALVGLGKKVRSGGGDLKFARPKGQPAEIFRLLRLDRAFEVFLTVEEALKKFA